MGNNISFRREFGLIVVGAVIFTASFLWRDFLTDVEELYFPKHRGLSNRFLYVLIVTIILVTIAILLRRVFGLSNQPEVTQQNISDADPSDRKEDAMLMAIEDQALSEPLFESFLDAIGSDSSEVFESDIR